MKNDWDLHLLVSVNQAPWNTVVWSAIWRHTVLHIRVNWLLLRHMYGHSEIDYSTFNTVVNFQLSLHTVIKLLLTQHCSSTTAMTNTSFLFQIVHLYNNIQPALHVYHRILFWTLSVILLLNIFWAHTWEFLDWCEWKFSIFILAAIDYRRLTSLMTTSC